MATKAPARKRSGRRPARKPVRRPARTKGKAPYRWLIFGPAIPAGLGGWYELGDFGHAAGALAFAAAGLLLVPVLMLTLLTAPGTLLHALVPKDWRRWWRKHDWRTGFRYPKKHPGPPGQLLQRMVRAADRNCCVSCGITAEQVYALAVVAAGGRKSGRLAQSTLQLDHRFPWILGGLKNFWNFFLLCPRCNIIKSSYWKYRESGNEVYSRHANPANIALARAILDRENQVRWSLARCWRAAWAL